MENTDESLFFTHPEDISKRKKLNTLFEQWMEQIRSCGDILFPDDGKYYPAESYFIKDGFYPGYFSGNHSKVLFIGRETRDTASCGLEKDRILCDLGCSFKNAPNAVSFFRRIFYIYYGILTEGKYPFCDIPYPDKMIEDKLYGFAFMNISKYSNDAENSAAADYDLINKFLLDSNLEKRNFVREEIEILDPDIIITANLWETHINRKYLELSFPSGDFTKIKAYKNQAVLYDFQFNGKVIKLIDTCHFSARGSDEEDFYKPVVKLLFG